MADPKPMTLTQKIIAAHATSLPRPWVQAGDVLQVEVDWTIASELAWNGMDRTYGLLGRPRLHDKDKFFLAVDHTVDPVTLATDKRAQKLVQLSRSFAQETGIRHFYDANHTILHTRFYRDLVRPGDLVLGADSHTSSHGGLSALAIGLGGADIVVAMVLGTSWIAVPVAPDEVVPVSEVQGMPLDGLFIGACTTTEEELVLGALVLEAEEKRAGKKGRKPPHPKQLVVPGDLSIQENLRRAGLWEIYQRNGFRIGPPGCSMCLGVASEKAGKGEKWLSSQNRNYENRMGEGSLAHLASAATVAASAAQMKVTDPRPLLAGIDQDRHRQILGERKQRVAPEVRVVEPRMRVGRGAQAGGAKQERTADRARAATVRARIQRFGDDVDTDAIIPGEFCHLTTLAELGAKCFHYVRPEFVERAREGATVVVAGKGWGSGSSREQAVLALKGAGIQAIVAQSYAFIHKRNLVNEALPFLVVDDPAFYELAQEGAGIEVELARGRVALSGKTFAAAEPSRIIQALASAGGIVPAIQRHGTEVFDKLTA